MPNGHAGILPKRWIDGGNPGLGLIVVRIRIQILLALVGHVQGNIKRRMVLHK